MTKEVKVSSCKIVQLLSDANLISCAIHVKILKTIKEQNDNIHLFHQDVIPVKPIA